LTSADQFREKLSDKNFFFLDPNENTAKMASMTGRIVLAAARRNVQYTPVRFCKSEYAD
jgi:hypothetical protein